MNRRIALRNIALISAGAVLMPSCSTTDDKTSKTFTNFSISGEKSKLLSALTETIMPATAGVPGAKELNTESFIWMMVDDCMNKEGREKFLKGLESFQNESEKQLNTSFVSASPEKRAEFLNAIESKKAISEDSTGFYSAVKRLTIQHFTNSKYYLTKVRVYELVPSRFHGCFPVAKS